MNFLYVVNFVKKIRYTVNGINFGKWKSGATTRLTNVFVKITPLITQIFDFNKGIRQTSFRAKIFRNLPCLEYKLYLNLFT